MIVLNYFSTEQSEDPIIKKFHLIKDFTNFLSDITEKGVWLATEDHIKGEVIVSNNLETVIVCAERGVFNLVWNDPQVFYLQRYSTYEDAYKVALSMMEGRENCYN